MGSGTVHFISEEPRSFVMNAFISIISRMTYHPESATSPQCSEYISGPEVSLAIVAANQHNPNTGKSGHLSAVFATSFTKSRSNCFENRT